MRPPLLKRQLFLRDSCQGRFLALNVMHQALVFIIFAGSLFLPLMITLYRFPLNSVEAQSVSTQFLALHERVWPAFPLALLLIGIHSLLFSHRIAGPIYRFGKVFEAVAQGDLTVPVNIRKHDYLQNEAGRLGAMLTSLRGKVSEIDGHAGQLKTQIVALRTVVSKELAGEAERLLEDLWAHHQQLEHSLQQFKTDTDVVVTR